MRLRNRVAIITGASKGIGRAIAIAFAREGAACALCARDGDRVAAVADELRHAGGRAISLPGDVADADDVQRLVDAALNEFGRIDVLVANAAVVRPMAKIKDMPLDRWRELIDINVTGVMLCNRAVLPHMIARNYGRIQNLGSGMEFAGEPSLGAYAASKGAVNAMTRTIAAEVAAYDIKVNVHYPGNIRTDMNPEGRGVPEDAVPCAVWLASLPPDGPTGRTFIFDKEIRITHEEIPRPT